MTPLARLLALPVRAYRLVLSPWVGHGCRYQPTCSAYALEALDRHGALRGGALTLRRLGRCHPWGGHGYDPVPGADPRHDARVPAPGPAEPRPALVVGRPVRHAGAEGGTPMSRLVYRIVEHDGGWAYQADGTYSETFASREAALRAAHRVAAEQSLADDDHGIEWEDADGVWHQEVASGTDRPETVVDDGTGRPAED